MVVQIASPCEENGSVEHDMAKSTIYIIRHAEAQPAGTPGLEDFDRTLTDEGLRDAARLGTLLHRLDLKVDAILTSPLPRALQTARLIAEALTLEDRLETVDVLSTDHSAREIADWLVTRSERRLALVGHNPWASDLVGLLAGAPGLRLNLRKSAVASLVGSPSGAYELDWVLRPRLVRNLAD
jgi:phosphohistidine phosphatase